jgi:malonate transporter and related proteins
MIEVVAALIPVFAIIALGAVLRRLAFLPEEGWRAVEQLTYFVLFPCFLFGAIAFADFANQPVGRMALLLAGAMLVMTALTFPFKSILTLDGPAFTSLFQGAVLGQPGLALIAIAVAVMVPLANLLCVVVLMRNNGQSANVATLARQLAMNPLILACIAGIAVQAIGLPLPKVAATTIDLLGKAALPLGLLAVGVSLDLQNALTRPSPVVTAILLKLAVMPLLVAVGATALGVTGPAQVAALICAAVPGAPSSYILARQLGGDAPLMANITTAQTLAAMLTMPIMLWVLT